MTGITVFGPSGAGGRGCHSQTMPRRGRIAGLAALTAFGMAACGSSTRASTSPTSGTNAPSGAATTPQATTPASTAAKSHGGALDACQLVTPQEAEAAFGVPLAPPKSQTSSQGGNCEYRPSGTHPAQNSLSVLALSNYSYQQLKDQNTKLKTKTMQQPLAGIGDEGVLLFLPGISSAQAIFRVGSTAVSIDLIDEEVGVSAETVHSRVQTMAAAAARRV